jgi:hypothetical protein
MPTPGNTANIQPVFKLLPDPINISPFTDAMVFRNAFLHIINCSWQWRNVNVLPYLQKKKKSSEFRSGDVGGQGIGSNALVAAHQGTVALPGDNGPYFIGSFTSVRSL